MELQSEIMSNIKDAIYGLAIGDALGVPYEFNTLDEMVQSPCTTMIGNGSYKRVDKGNWSDDTSLTLASMASITDKDGVDKKDMLVHFKLWLFNDDYTSNEIGQFDVGNTTRASIEYGMGARSEYSNGNGSLMRIIPLAYYTLHMRDITDRFNLVKKCSSITHGHMRSVLACFFYVEFARLMLLDSERSGTAMIKWFNQAHVNLNMFIDDYPGEKDIFTKEFNLQPDKIKSSTYVMHTLNVVFYCFLETSNYKDCVLKAINYGEDTDTTGAIVGALAGIYYGRESIPSDWINTLENKNLINTLCDNWNDKYE